MNRDRSYLDHNATSPLRPEVLAATVEALRSVGNPSSVHREGRAARALVEAAREKLAALVDADPDDVVFTSGGTEANATALRPGALLTPDGRPVLRLITSAVEHASVLHGHAFPADATVVLPVDRDGRLDPEDLQRALAGSNEPTLVSVQHANSETGVVQPVAELARTAHRARAAFHTDAVQTAGRIPVSARALGTATLSGHKLGGPPGIGALVVPAAGRGPNIQLIGGGGQERRTRAGTENVAGIVGFGVAAELAATGRDAEAARLRGLRDRAVAELRRLAPAATVFGEGAERLPNTLAFAVSGVTADTALIALDLDGVAASSGSACSSGRVARSHVLAAMGVPDELAPGALRLSFGWNSSQEDVTAFADAFERLTRRLYEQGRARAA